MNMDVNELKMSRSIVCLPVYIWHRFEILKSGVGALFSDIKTTSHKSEKAPRDAAQHHLNHSSEPLLKSHVEWFGHQFAKGANKNRRVATRSASK